MPEVEGQVAELGGQQPQRTKVSKPNERRVLCCMTHIYRVERDTSVDLNGS